MPRVQELNHAFNRGEVDVAAMARVDVERLQIAAEIQENLLPYVIGKAQFRGGTEHLDTSKSNNFAQFLKFVKSVSDTALLELTSSVARVWIAGVLLTRGTVATTIDDGDFDAATAWTLATAGSSTASIAGGVLDMAAPSLGGRSTATNDVTIAAPDQGVAHGILIDVERGPVVFRAGTTSGAEDIISTRTLRTGTHSIECTPTGASLFVQFEETKRYSSIVADINIEAAGGVELATPWTTDAELKSVRSDQSGDVLFCASSGDQQRRIERWDARSWSLVKYEADDGPFKLAPSSSAALTPDATSGDITLTSDLAFFSSNHVGSILQLTHPSLNQATSIAAEDTFTEAFEVTGTDAARDFTWTMTGLTSSGSTVTLQRSFDGPDSGFVDVESKTADITSEAESDSFDNQSVWYRAGIKTGNYGAGTQIITFDYPGGGGSGVVRITAFASTTSVSAKVLSSLKAISATQDWLEGRWSDVYTYPSAVSFFDGRLFWAGDSQIWGSVSDAFHTFDLETVGDSGPILRDVATGAVNDVRWLLSLQRLMIGTEGSEVSARSSSFDEPLTPTAFTLKDASTRGNADLDAVRVDTFGLFVQRSGQKVFELVFNIEAGDYTSNNITRLNADIAGDGFTDVALQREPDTRVWYPRVDGQCALLLYERKEGATGWFRVIGAPTSAAVATIEAVEVLPAVGEDEVYFSIKRTVDGNTVRHIEKMAASTVSRGGAINKMADGFVHNAGPVTAFTGLDHLEGETVVAWGNSKSLGSYTVASGAITLSESATEVTVGLQYDWRYKSAKLAYGSGVGTSLVQKKRVDGLGLLLVDTHTDAITYGKDFTTMRELPKVFNAEPVADDTVFTTYDEGMTTFPGSWDTDARIHLKGSAPFPATLLGMVFTMQTNDRG